MALDPLRPGDVSVALLVALAGLNPVEREMWIDQYLLGIQPRNRLAVANANRKLREHFQSTENLREAA